VEEIPGLSSALAVPGPAGVPLTFRGLSRGFAVITGHCDAGATDWKRYAAVDTLVILMGVHRRAEIAAALLEAGRAPEEPAAFIERGSTDRERVITATLERIARGEIDVESPAVFVVGEVVGVRLTLLPHCVAAATGE
jgi:uroporphyrin-III C-methyltransferase